MLHRGGRVGDEDPFLDCPCVFALWRGEMGSPEDKLSGLLDSCGPLTYDILDEPSERNTGGTQMHRGSGLFVKPSFLTLC